MKFVNDDLNNHSLKIMSADAWFNQNLTIVGKKKKIAKMSSTEIKIVITGIPPCKDCVHPLKIDLTRGMSIIHPCILL